MTVPTVQRCYAALHTSASVWDAKTGLYDLSMVPRLCRLAGIPCL